MSRWASSANATEALKGATHGVFMADLDFASGMIRAHDGAGTVIWNGNEYLGGGQLLGFDQIEESLDYVPRGVTLRCSGVAASIISTAMTEIYQGRAVTIYLALLDDKLQLIDTPETVWAGVMDTMYIELDQGEGSISVACEYRIRREAEGTRYTDQDQRLRAADDSFFDLIHLIPGYRATWGEKTASFSNGPGGGGRGGPGRGQYQTP